jgi:predicted nucleic acid-binding protein
MTDAERFDQNARTSGVLIDTNLFVLLIVGLVNRDRISAFKRTSNFTPADWDLLVGLIEHIPQRYSIAHVLAEANTLTDMKGQEKVIAREMLQRVIAITEEVHIPSVEACASPYYWRLGLTDAAIGLAAKKFGCSIITNDSDLYIALMQDGASVLKFDHLKAML